MGSNRNYRIQTRKGSSNIIEKRFVTVEGKEKWIPFIAPLCRKEEGDEVAELLLEFVNNNNELNN